MHRLIAMLLVSGTLGVLTTAGCGSAPLPPPTVLPDGGAAPTDGGFTCTPGQSFADGPRVWSCTYEGTDAVIVGDCDENILPDAGIAGGPGVIASRDCPSGYRSTGTGVGNEFICCGVSQ